MAEQPDNLILQLLRAIRADVSALREDVTELKVRQNETNRLVLAGRREQAADAESVAVVQVQIDRVWGEIERIKRRLDIVE